MTQRDSHGVRGRLRGQLRAQPLGLRLDRLRAYEPLTRDILAAEPMRQVPERVNLDRRQLIDSPGRPLPHDGRVTLGLALVLGLVIWALLGLLGYAVWTLA